MSKDKRCICTFVQSLVGDGCRYCQPQDYIDRLRDEIKDMQEDYDKLFNEKSTVWNLTYDKSSWQGLSDDEIDDIKTKAIMGANGMSVEQLLGLIVSLTEQALRIKNDSKS